MVKLTKILGANIGLVNSKVLNFYNNHLKPKDKEEFLTIAQSRKDVGDCYGCKIKEKYRERLCNICDLIYDDNEKN